VQQTNTEIVRDAYEQFISTGAPDVRVIAADFAWDMSTFRGWPEQQVYDGLAGQERFLSEWLATWEEWVLEAESFREAGDTVVAVMHQRGRSKTSGLQVDMHFAQVWTLRDGKIARMEMYADPAEAFEAAGLEVP
jgi:uncharacterized protein